MKKILTIIAATLLLGMGFTGCKKDDCPTPTNITGKWVGKYGTGANPQTFDFTIFINSDGELGVIDGLGNTPTAKGTWSLSGNTFRGTYKYLPNGSMFSVQATLTDNNTKLSSGTYGNNDAYSGAGTFTVTKQ